MEEKRSSERISKHITEARAAAQRAKLDEQAESRSVTPQAPKGAKTRGKKEKPDLLARRRASTTIECALADYLADHEGGNSSPETVQWYAISLGLLKSFLEKERGITLVGEVDAPDISAWFTYLRKTPGNHGRPRAERTVQSYARAARAFFHWLVHRETLDRNPFDRVAFPKVGKPLIRIIEPEEFERLLQACTPPGEVGPLADRAAARNRAILWLLYDTGIRLAELCNLRLGDFDRKQGVIIVKGKGSKERRIALGSNCLRNLLYYLDRHRADEEYALRQGLEVWFSPSWIDGTQQEMLTYLAQCAQAAEHLRQQSPQMVFVVGCELTFFLQGLVEGNTALERMQTFMKPWRLLKSTLVKGPFNTSLNAFLAQATAVVRERFHGPLTYASGPWEAVDWTPFDFVGIDYYRDASNASSYQQTLRKYFTHGKPVVILEFGCCTYQGAQAKGGYGWAIVDRTTTPNQLQGAYVRDEQGQATYLRELLDIFREEHVEGAFVFTFVMPSYPYHDDPRYDLDMASYSLVKTYVNHMGRTYHGMPWEPKESFQQVADSYQG